MPVRNQSGVEINLQGMQMKKIKQTGRYIAVVKRTIGHNLSEVPAHTTSQNE
jgi:hypothetical protein